MISELDSKGGAEIVSMFNKLTEVIRALNAIEAASTSDNSRYMQCAEKIMRSLSGRSGIDLYQYDKDIVEDIQKSVADIVSAHCT